LFGSVDEVAAALRPYAEAGADRLMIMHSLHTDLDSIVLIGEHLAPRLTG
jgi:alkanesulfonate monooxygenase SsuD/methylene tetrahydromethanopterin reductase-like flavin-dependent oxidoreductase (luciferase family)